MKVAVSGANGFIGRHVVAALERHGAEPVLWVRPRARGGDVASRHAVVAVDVLDPPPRVFDALGRPDALVHLAWGGLPNYGSAHHLEVELPGHARTLTALVEQGLSNLVVAGTCFEYGMQSGALAESAQATPTNAYGIAKDRLRLALQAVRRAHPFHLTWARLFYLHGDGQSPGALLSQLGRAVAAGDARFPMSGGEQLRDYLPVEEAADDLVRLALADRDHGIVNVCSGQPISVRALVERWLAEHGRSIALDLGRYPNPAHEPMAFWGDDAKLRRCLDARPETVER